MPKFCPKCKTKPRSESANFCRACGYDFRQRSLPVRRQRDQLSSFDALRRFAAVMDDQRGWLQENTLLEPVQEVVDNIRLRTEMEEASEQQKEQVLAGYQKYTDEQIEQVIDRVRHARQMAEADVLLDIKEQNLEIEDEFAARRHERRMKRMEAQHKHEKELMELRAQLELTNAFIQSYNQLFMIRMQAMAQGQADIQQMQMLTQVIQQSFTALTEIDAGLLKYEKRIKELDFEDKEEAWSYQVLDDLVEDIKDRISRGVLDFAEQSGTD